MEQHDLSITATHAYLIFRYCLYAFDALRAYVLREHQYLVLNLEAAEVSTWSSGKQELLSGFTESETCIVSYVCPRVYKLWLHWSIRGIQRPDVKFFCTTHRELIAGCITKLDIFLEAPPLYALWCFCVNSWKQLQLWDNESTLCVPDEQLAIKLVSSWQKKPVIVWEIEVRDLMVMFWKSKDCSFRSKVPKDYICIITFLAYKTLENQFQIPEAIRCPPFAIARHVIWSSWAVRKFWVCGSLRSPTTIEQPAIIT